MQRVNKQDPPEVWQGSVQGMEISTQPLSIFHVQAHPGSYIVLLGTNLLDGTLTGCRALRGARAIRLVISSHGVQWGKFPTLYLHLTPENKVE